MRMVARWTPGALAFVAVLMASGCGESPTSVLPHSGPLGAVQPLCQLGCGESDPNPSAPGIFLGSGVTPIACRRTSTHLVTDSDGDLLSDFCETQLGVSFAPELDYTYGDDVRREPYFAARFSGAVDDGTVEIAYLLSYYRDTGSKQFDPGLGAHNGDSEYIILYLYYDYDSEHWVLNTAYYSQHDGYGVYSSLNNAYPTQLYYPSHIGTYPRSWVAEGKHANYATQGECNGGGPLGNDTCVDNNTTARVEVSSYWNIGARNSHSIDCVVSRNPSYEYYGMGRQECYWTARNFRGWVPDSIGGGDSGTSYSSILSNFVF